MAIGKLIGEQMFIKKAAAHYTLKWSHVVNVCEEDGW